MATMQDGNGGDLPIGHGDRLTGGARPPDDHGETARGPRIERQDSALAERRDDRAHLRLQASAAEPAAVG